MVVLAVIAVLSVTMAVILANKKETVEIPSDSEDVTASVYTLIKNPTNYQKEVFNELKTLLESKDYSDKDLALVLAKNFLVEFYNLSNVTSKDVRGLQFVATELQNRFKEFGWNIYNFYPYYENIKDLEITGATITKTKAITYDFVDDLKIVTNRNDLSGYEVTLEWYYKDEVKNTTIITIVKWDDSYSIIKVQN
jgi:hypothetical protein